MYQMVNTIEKLNREKEVERDGCATLNAKTRDGFSDETLFAQTWMKKGLNQVTISGSADRGNGTCKGSGVRVAWT